MGCWLALLAKEGRSCELHYAEADVRLLNVEAQVADADVNTRGPRCLAYSLHPTTILAYG